LNLLASLNVHSINGGKKQRIKESFFSNNYRDHTYRVPIKENGLKENGHIEKYLKW
jgi:hypothetical protein